MPAGQRVLALILLASLLVAGCGSVEPTAPSVPVTATRIALEPTHTRYCQPLPRAGHRHPDRT